MHMVRNNLGNVELVGKSDVGFVFTASTDTAMIAAPMPNRWTITVYQQMRRRWDNSLFWERATSFEGPTAEDVTRKAQEYVTKKGWKVAQPQAVAGDDVGAFVPTGIVRLGLRARKGRRRSPELGWALVRAPKHPGDLPAIIAGGGEVGIFKRLRKSIAKRAKSVWKGVKKYGGKALQYGTPVGLIYTAAKNRKALWALTKKIGSWPVKALGAAAKAMTYAAAFPIRKAVKPGIMKTAQVIARKNGRKTPNKADRVAAGKIFVGVMKKHKNPLVKFGGMVLSYSGTGVSGSMGAQWEAHEMGLAPAVVAGLAGAAGAAIVLVLKALIGMAVSKAGGGAPEEGAPPEGMPPGYGGGEGQGPPGGEEGEAPAQEYSSEEAPSEEPPAEEMEGDVPSSKITQADKKDVAAAVNTAIVKKLGPDAVIMLAKVVSSGNVPPGPFWDIDVYFLHPKRPTPEKLFHVAKVKARRLPAGYGVQAEVIALGKRPQPRPGSSAVGDSKAGKIMEKAGETILRRGFGLPFLLIPTKFLESMRSPPIMAGSEAKDLGNEVGHCGRY